MHNISELLGHTGRTEAPAEDMGQNMSAVAGCCDKRDEDFKRKRSGQGGRDGKLLATPSRKACSVQLLIAACSIGLARVLADPDSRSCRNRRPGAASGAGLRAIAVCGTVSAYPRMLGATGFPSRGSVHTRRCPCPFSCPNLTHVRLGTDTSSDPGIDVQNMWAGRKMPPQGAQNVLPPDWEEVFSKSTGKHYFYNRLNTCE